MRKVAGMVHWAGWGSGGRSCRVRKVAGMAHYVRPFGWNRGFCAAFWLESVVLRANEKEARYKTTCFSQ